MANLGAQYPVFAPFEGEELENSLPKYKEGVKLGKLIAATLTVTRAAAELFADDELDESVNEFVSASIAMDVNDMDDEIEPKLFGSKQETETGEVIDSKEDEAPLGGLGYIKVKIRGGKRKYKAFWYPKTKATQGDDAATTKSNSPTLSGENIIFTVMMPRVGNWRYHQTFDTMAEARAYIQGKIKKEDAAVTDM